MVETFRVGELVTYARPIEKIKQRSNFFFVCNCNCQIAGTGIRKIHTSVIRLVMLVKYVNSTSRRQSPLTLLSQKACIGRQARAKVIVMPSPQAMTNAIVARTTFRKNGMAKTR